MYRGQSYHYQRGYQLNKLRFENRLQNDPYATRPKEFFEREYHLGRHVPKTFLELTQVDQLPEAAEKVISGDSEAPNQDSLIEKSVNDGRSASGTSGNGDKSPPVIVDNASGISTPNEEQTNTGAGNGANSPSGGNDGGGETNGNTGGEGSNGTGADSMKTMSDYQQRLYATKAALKAAIQNGDKDISILQFLREHNKFLGGLGRPGAGGDRDEQIKEGYAGKGDKESDLNKNVMFDEQIKEDLNKIQSYDPK